MKPGGSSEQGSRATGPWPLPELYTGRAWPTVKDPQFFPVTPVVLSDLGACFPWLAALPGGWGCGAPAGKTSL